MILLKKAARSMWDNKKAYIACILLITIGVFVNIVTGICAEVFGTAKDKYYEEYRLADIFAKVNSMPAAALPDIERIEGIREAAGRYVYEARIVTDDSDKVISLRISSVDRSYEGMPINGIIVKGNEWREPTDIMVDAAFLSAHGLRLGDSIRAVINKKEYVLNICAVADSPEYVYPIKNASEIMPNPELFGYAFMPIESLWAFSGQYGFYNDICMEMEDGAVYESIKSPLEDELKKYGMTSLFLQKDQLSVSMVNMELDSIGTISRSMPMMFMLMAIVVLYMMLKRIIEQERTQIGVLKAFGYSNGAVVMHYVFYGAVTGTAGGLLGCVYGLAASGPYVEMFKQYFNLPTENTGVPIGLLVRGLVLAMVSGVAGGYFGARRSLKLQPAESMRPEAPKAEKFDLMKKMPILNLMLSTGGNMAIRSIVRNKMRSAVIVLGLVFSFGLMAFMGSYNTMIDFMMLNLFSKVQLYDAKMIFNTPVDYNQALQAAYGIEGVSLAEAVLEIPVEFKNKNLKMGASLMGMEKGTTLYRIYDNEKDTAYQPPESGILINDVLAGKLNAKKGDTLYLSSPILDKDVKLVVTEVCQQNLGVGAYMEINAMADLFNLKKVATAAIVKADDMTGLNSSLDEAENLTTVEDKTTVLKGYENLLAPFGILIYIMWLMSVLISFAIIYNTSTISLSERKREYATLRVLGMHVSEVGEIMSFEYWLLCFIGIILGIPFNVLLKQTMASFFASDAFTFPTFTPVSAYVMAAAGCMAAVFLANRSAVKQIKKFDMVEVLKERE